MIFAGFNNLSIFPSKSNCGGKSLDEDSGHYDRFFRGDG
jgi:hypothetical protein